MRTRWKDGQEVNFTVCAYFNQWQIVQHLKIKQMQMYREHIVLQQMKYLKLCLEDVLIPLYYRNI